MKGFFTWLTIWLLSFKHSGLKEENVFLMYVLIWGKLKYVF